MKMALPEFITDKNFKRQEYDVNEKEVLLQYMKNEGELCAAGGFVEDIITGERTRIEAAGYRDEGFEWSTDDIYHIEKYDAAVTDDFLNHVLNKHNVKKGEET